MRTPRVMPLMLAIIAIITVLTIRFGLWTTAEAKPPDSAAATLEARIATLEAKLTQLEAHIIAKTMTREEYVEYLQNLPPGTAIKSYVDNPTPPSAKDQSCAERIRQRFLQFCSSGNCARANIDLVTPGDCHHLSEERRHAAAKGEAQKGVDR